jgi:hypothetical protein
MGIKGFPGPTIGKPFADREGDMLLCIVGYLLSALGLVFLLTGADLWKDSGAISDVDKAKRTSTILRLVALPMIPIGMYYFLNARAEPGNNLEILMLLGSALMAIIGLLALVTGWNFFGLLGDASPLQNPTPGSVRRFGLVSLTLAALVFLRASMFGLF